MFSNENEHVGIEFPIKATKHDTMHSTFTPSLHLVPFFPTTKSKTTFVLLVIQQYRITDFFFPNNYMDSDIYIQ